jgi:hypothetical protein
MGFFNFLNIIPNTIKGVLQPFNSLASGIGGGFNNAGKGVSNFGTAAGKVTGSVANSTTGLLSTLTSPIGLIGIAIVAVIILPKLLDKKG